MKRLLISIVVILLVASQSSRADDNDVTGKINNSQFEIGNQQTSSASVANKNEPSIYPHTFVTISPVCPKQGNANEPIPCGAGSCNEGQQWSSVTEYVVDGANAVGRPTSTTYQCTDSDNNTEALREKIIWEFQRVQPDISAPKTQPADSAIVNFDEIFFSDAKSEYTKLTLLGNHVILRITPTHFEWKFGDNTELSTADPGKPYPEQTVTHKYRSTGDVHVLVEVTYSGRYSVNGGPFQQIDGTVTRQSPLARLHVYEARAELVDPGEAR